MKNSTLPWIEAAPGAPYFVTADGDDWTPIGQNDAITWPELAGACRRCDLPAAARYLQKLQQSGVTTLRLMLEYSQDTDHFLEGPGGVMQPHMVRLWDDLFTLCEQYGLRVLLTPYDTFWMWLNWDQHPYNRANGGPCANRGEWLLCKDTRAAIKRRFAFAIERWGGSGALFAWDVWNELHPAHGANSTAPFADFVEDLSTFVRDTELRRYGRCHPRTVSVFGPTLVENPQIAGVVFRHPSLDFASTHFYERDTIDCPADTVQPAISTGALMAEALAQITDHRPFLDSEHGPIHLFKDRGVTLPEPFDDEYFRHMQWAHFAAGGAGGGMRWPNRHPHTLTAGMRAAQGALARFLPLIDWQRFARRNLNADLRSSSEDLALFGCGDDQQAVAWLLRTDSLGADGTLRCDAEPLYTSLAVPGLRRGSYRVTTWDTCRGAPMTERTVKHEGGDVLCLALPPIRRDLAVAVSVA